MVKRGSMSGTLVGPRTGPDNALELAFAGTMPNSITEMNRWTILSPWTVLHNFTRVTTGPIALAAAPGSISCPLSKWGLGADSVVAGNGQSRYALQKGFTATSNLDYLIRAVTDTTWGWSSTVPTCYMFTLKFGGTPANGQIFLHGMDGANGGYYFSAHSTSGIRAAIGSGSGYVNTSYVGGTSFYDGEYHTIMLVVDDAGGKAKLYTEFGNTESTGLTIAVNMAATGYGPWDRNIATGCSVTYLLGARGEHAGVYASAQDIFNKYEGARLRGGA